MRLTIFATATVIVALVSSAIAATGDIKATFNFEASDFVADPSQPFIYGSVLNSSSVVVLNTNTLAVDHTIPLAASSTGMALSPDGNSLYITESSNKSIAVMDTHSFTITRRISLSSVPIDVAAGLDNRLYVLQYGSLNKVLRQIDATTGASTGSDLASDVFWGNLQTSPDRKTLYFAEEEMSPATLSAFDVSTTSPTCKLRIFAGFNGIGAVISHSGNWAALPVAGGGYPVGILNTSDFSTIGSFNDGPYPNSAAFSLDDAYLYLGYHGSKNCIDVVSTSTFSKVNGFSTPDSPGPLLVDPSGKDLFASFWNGQTIVYDTGYSVPEPATLSILAVALTAFLLKRAIHQAWGLLRFGSSERV